MRGFCSFLAVLATVAFFAPSVAAVESFPLITKVSIRGNGDISRDEIKIVVSEIIPDRRIFFWRPRPPLDPVVVERNIRFLRQFLVGSGYHKSSVVWRKKESRDGKTAELKIDIDLGGPTVVASVEIQTPGEGFLPPAHRDRLYDALAEVPLERGKRFGVRRFKKGKGVVKNTLLEMGYAAAEVESRGEVNRSDRQARLIFTVDPGGVHTFGDIEIDVSDQSLRDVVIGAITYKTGEPSAPSKILESKRRLNGLGFFESVSITPEVDSENLSVRTIVRAVGRKNRTFQLGVGAGREDVVRGRVKFINRNFLNLNRTLELSARASFALQSASATIQQPGFWGPDSILSALFDIRREDYRSHEADFLIWSTKTEKGFGNGLFAVRFTPTVIDSNIKRAHDDDETGLENIFLVLLRGGFSVIRTDNPLDPARGFYFDADWEFSSGVFGSESEYFKSVFDVAGYYDFGGHLGGVVLAKRIQAGFIEPFGDTGGDDVPIFRRLFAGGDSMRGFAFQTLGPLDENEIPCGGNSLLTGSVEVRFPLPWVYLGGELGGVAFFDYGNVSEGSPKCSSSDDIRYATGFGLRYKVSGIPIGLDFGYALNPDPRLRRYQFLFNIGQAF